MNNTTRERGSYARLNYMQKLANYTGRKRRGDVALIAERTGYSTTHVSDVLGGKYSNERILNAAYDHARGRKTNLSWIA